MGMLTLSNENLINVYQNEPELWNAELNATEEAKELAWRRMCDVFGMKSAGTYGLALLDSSFTQIDQPVYK